jgi:hypothetical protein
MGGACSTTGDEEEFIWTIIGEIRKKETTRKAKTYVVG